MATSATPAPDTAASAYSNAPTDAPGFARRAAAFVARRDFAHAIDDLTHAIALDPKSADYPYQRGIAERANGQGDQAVADFDLALKVDPGDFDALMMRATQRATSGQVALAHQGLVDVSKTLADDGDRRFAVAGSFESAGFHKEAIEQYDRWIGARPKSSDGRMAMALNERCWARAELGQELDKALADCDQALKLRPGVVAFLDSRGLVKLRMADLDGAIADYDAALKGDPKGSWSLYGRGLAKLKTGDKAAGEADIKAALAIDSSIADQAKAVGLTP